MKTFLAEAREIQLQAQRHGVEGGLVAKLRSDAIDIILEALYTRVGKDAENITLVATGGYGRAELCPLSDIDLLVLVPSHNASTKKSVEQILYPLWDIGLKVGQSVRTVTEATSYAQDDLHLQVALLETRYLCGATEPYNQLTTKLSKALSGDKWMPLAKAIVESQRKRREKAGGSAYLQEPDLKNGVGALRDVQGCIWLARLKSGSTASIALSTSGLLPNGDFQKFQQARTTLLRIRCELHFQVTRSTEQLSLERQNLVAEGLGFSGDLKDRIGTLMRMYFDAADHVRRCVELVEASILNEPEPKGYGKPIVVDGFTIIPGGIASAQHRLVFDEDPGRLVRLFRLCQIHDAQPERSLSILVRERAHLLDTSQAFSESSCNALRAMLMEGGRVYKAIHALREHDLLYRLVPEFAGLHCLVQFEFYHRWTADVHTLRCLWELDEIYSGKTEIERAYREILFGLESPSLVYAILFLHDIAKSGGIAGHAERGVPIADQVLERLGFDSREREIARVVILNHLIMGLYWQRHDIDEPRNIERFAHLLGDEQILRALYVHTRCDARGTSPDLWTDFKDRQHWTLYRRTSDKIAGTAENQSQENVRLLRNATEFSDW
jgi:[protein-PII] uridylyltransferase